MDLNEVFKDVKVISAPRVEELRPGDQLTKDEALHLLILLGAPGARQYARNPEAYSDGKLPPPVFASICEVGPAKWSGSTQQANTWNQGRLSSVEVVTVSITYDWGLANRRVSTAVLFQTVSATEDDVTGRLSYLSKPGETIDVAVVDAATRLLLERVDFGTLVASVPVSMRKVA